MLHKKKNQAPREGLVFRNAVLSLSISDNSDNLSQAQASYIASRFGLDATRARLTAELVWGRP